MSSQFTALSPFCSRYIKLGTTSSLLFSLLFTLSSPSVASTYYRWVDKNGVTHYTTTPPKNGKAVIVNTTTGGKKSTSPFKETPSEKEVEQAQKKQAICETAKANLKTLQTSDEVKMTDEYGVEKVMSKEERDAELERAQKAIKEHCAAKEGGGEN